ncbi:MAG: BMP family ABC transporter substrate-binding protein [Candidatus Tectomicrobia bacterium]|nr:BMP family ABC transporter substrate-binding protein [Candidatus Tectomicrobia bacterium]
MVFSTKIKKFRLFNFFLLVILTLFVLSVSQVWATDCGEDRNTSGEPIFALPVSQVSAEVKVGLIFDAGGKDDKSFNTAAWEGATRARNDLKITLKDVEPGDPAAIEPAMRAFAEMGFDVVIGVGFAAAPHIEAVAKDFPKLKFAIVDAVVNLPNVSSLVFKEHEGSFLVGMFAAMKSKTNTIGFVGGMDIPLIRKFALGYEEGAKQVNPGITVLKNYAGVTMEAWSNPTKGKEMAKAQYARGADVIFAAAGATGLGVFDAAEEEKKFVIGVDSNQNWVKPGFVLTSMLKRVDVAVYETIKSVTEKNFVGGIRVFGLENKGIGYAVDEHNKNLLTQAMIDAVEKAKADILTGKIRVTDYTAK